MDEKDELLRRTERWRRALRTRPEGVPRPGPGQESVWGYPRPPRIEAVDARVCVELAGVLLADTREALRVLETASPPTYYLPRAAVRTELLEPGTLSSLCEWKGRARYWSARVGSRAVANVAWGYPDPFAEYAALAGSLAFFPGRVDACTVGGERVQPQPGDYYGGWITKNLLGPFKGEPGSEGW